jgi:hypothetical protein
MIIFQRIFIIQLDNKVVEREGYLNETDLPLLALKLCANEEVLLKP